MRVENGIVFPDPTPERVRMLTRGEAVKVMEAVDDAGFACTLNVRVLSQDGRDYTVLVNMDGLDAIRLKDLQEAASAVPEANTIVDSGWFTVS